MFTALNKEAFLVIRVLSPKRPQYHLVYEHKPKHDVTAKCSAIGASVTGP